MSVPNDLNQAWPVFFQVENSPNPEIDTSSFQSWDFNIWLVEKSDFIRLSMAVLNQFNLPKIFDITPDIWVNFMTEVLRLMSVSTNPYHNATHIMDVLQSTACLIKEFAGNKFLSDLDVLAILVAAIIHDLEHPGTNNVYQVNAATSLAIRYNDISVLENHHSAKAFELFMNEKMNIFHKLTAEQYKQVRKTIIGIVLSTDMTNHFALKAELEDCILRVQTLLATTAANGTGNGTPNRRPSLSLLTTAPGISIAASDALIIMKSMLHAADISNPGKKFTVSRLWSDKVVEEFFEQGDREKKEGLPVSMNCDRNTVRQDELSVNFADFIVAPFYFTLTKLLPKCTAICREIKQNRTIWHNMIVSRLKTDLTASEGGSNSQIEQSLASWENRNMDFNNKFTELMARYDMNRSESHSELLGVAKSKKMSSTSLNVL